MRYGLLRPDKSVLEISHENFAALKWSYLRLLQMAHIEEKFDVALENMLELEQEFLSEAAADMMFHLRDSSHDQAKLNRRFVNLLTSCRLYLDHSDRHAYDLFGRESSEAAEVRALRSKLYDSHLGYRVMEELRNHVQHRGLPVHIMAHDSALDERGKGRHSVSAYLDPSTLRQEGKFKGAILRELEAAKMQDTDLLALARDYIECLGVIHFRIRMHAQDGNERALKQFAESLTLIRREGNTVDADTKSANLMPGFLRSAVEWRFRDIRCALTVVSRTAEEQSQFEFMFPNTMEIRRRELEAKNARPPRLSRDYVSSRTDDEPLFDKVPPTPPDISWE